MQISGRLYFHTGLLILEGLGETDSCWIFECLDSWLLCAVKTEIGSSILIENQNQYYLQS